MGSAKAVSTRTASEPAGGRLPFAARWIALSFCLLFCLLGLVLIPYPGIQNDEVLFAGGIYPPIGVQSSVPLFHHHIPIMLMTYIGALKIWFYWLLFQVWPPSPYSVRVPMLLAGVATIWLFFLLMRKTVGLRAALAGCALLAADTTFLMTTCFDWGPVAIQHLMLVGGILLVWEFRVLGRLAWLGGGFFLFGLGLWDKALFAWMLAGLAVAAATVYPRELFSRLHWRNVAVAVFAFVAGALPFLLYNASHSMDTVTGNAHFSAAGVDKKAYIVRLSLEGSSLFGYMVREDPAPAATRPRNAIERFSVALSHATGAPRVGFLAAGFFLAMLLIPWLWNTPARGPMMFAIIFMAVTWLQMAFTLNAGGGTHHAVLLWPFPHFFVAVAYTELSRHLRRGGLLLLAALIGTICVSDYLVINQHLAQLVERGPTAIWTDAIGPLEKYLEQARPNRVFVTDWGIYDALRLVSAGRLPLAAGSDPVSTEAIREDDRHAVTDMLATPGALFVGHTDADEVIPGAAARLRQFAQSAGYSKETATLIKDRHGRVIFDVYRYRPEPARVNAALRTAMPSSRFSTSPTAR